MSKYLPHFVATAILLWFGLRAQSNAQVAAPAEGGSRVTPVTGESWLDHLHRSFNETSMGKTNRLGPRPSAPGEEEASNWKLGSLADFSPQSEAVRGSDFYRLNCQGCHRESGLGAPPEISSIIGPIRATSATLVMERMRSMGMEVSRSDAIQLAKQSESALWQRLHTGGQSMPSFGHLSTAEVQALVAYLRELAGVPGAGRGQRVLRESSVRVGELIVKSTCHICHGATGPNPSPEQLKAGAIPPLATLTARTTFAGFIRKVTVGALLVTSDAAMPRRGRMPVFNYLSQKEAADVYLYLSLYPPSENQFADPGHSSAELGPNAAEARLTFASLSSASSSPKSGVVEQKQTVDWMPLVLFAAIVWFTVHLLAGGLAFTVREFKRLSARNVPAVQRISADVEERLPHKRLTARGGGKELMRRTADAADVLNRVQTRRGSYGTTENAKFHKLTPVLLVGVVTGFSQASYAIPAFARQYRTSCSTCHLDFPKLNDFGKAFKDAGFKFPKDDEQMLKIPPVMLGAPANREAWPKSIWPGTIPGIPPIGLRLNNYFQYVGASKAKFAALTPAGSLPPFVPRTDFETGFFSIFSAGNFGSDIAFWVDDDISVSGANANGSLGDGYLKFINIGRFLKLPEKSLNLRVGQFELELPFTQARSLWISPYDIYTESNIGALNSMFPLQQFVNNQFTLANVARGVELSGGLHTRGYNYSIAIINQNTSGIAQSANPGSPYLPQATGSNAGGMGVASDANFKDLYSDFQYRFNLERNKESRSGIQAAGPTGPHDHTYLNLGVLSFYGRSVQRLLGAQPSGTPTVVTAREPFYRVGGNFTFNYRNLQFNALYIYGHDVNLLPINAAGDLIPLQNLSTAVPVGFIHSRPATFSGGFADVEWLAYPWVMVLMRYDGVNSAADRINGLIRNPDGSGFTGAPFNAPFRSTRNRFTPGVQFLIHANIKASFEYQFRPSQSVVVATNPLTGLPVALNPFHTKTATAGLEFVY